MSTFHSAYARMRTDIIFGQLSPSYRLRLEDLREVYDAPVATLREVLNRLTSEGLVVAEGARGFAVAPISIENLLELAALRKLIELHALEQSFLSGDGAWEAEIIAAHGRLSRIEKRMIAGEHCDNTEWRRHDFGFHQTLIKGCRSIELLIAHQGAFDKYLRYQMLYLTFRGEIAANEHRALLDAALARDVPKAQAILVRHIDGGLEHAMAAHSAKMPMPV